MKKLKHILLLMLIALMVTACDFSSTAHKHTYEEEWSYDEEYHFHEATCEHEVVSSKARHKFDDGVTTADGGITYTCTICGFTKEETDHTHEFSKEWSSDENNHFHKATCGHDVVKDVALHTFDEGVVVKEATETLEGVKKYTCTICNYEKEEVIPVLGHTHKFAEEWSSDENNHFHEATCGHDVVKDSAPHTFNDGVIVKEATETETGIKRYKCTVCDYEKDEVIPVLSHTHKFAEERSSDENNHFHEATCGHDVVKDLAPHTFNDGVIVKEATETETGIKRYKCTVCSFEKEEIIPLVQDEGLHINGYNTQNATTGFAQYNGLVLYKKGVTLGSSLYWHKVAITERDGKYYVSAVAPESVATPSSYDYLLLSWKDDQSGMYTKLVDYNFQVGDEVVFSADITTLVAGSVSINVKKVTLGDTFEINYELGYDAYNTKDDLYKAFYSDYYYFLIANTDCDMSSYNINNVDEFLSFCKDWTANGGNEMAGIGNAFGKYYLAVDKGGTFETQPTTHFIGYCYQNNKYLDLLEFLEVFFAYWRTDEGYSKSDPYGNDFFASSWASFVDTCKYFYFTSATLTTKYKWFTIEKSPRVHYALDHTPNVLGSALGTTYAKGTIVTLPNVTRLGYSFLGWFDKDGNKVEKVSTDATVYAKFERLIYQVTYKDGSKELKEETVKHGLRTTAPSTPSKLGYTFVGWVNNAFEEYDLLNGVTSDMTLYAKWEKDATTIGTLTVNAYNTQGATTGFAQYEGLELFKSGIQLGSSLYWYKVAIVEVDGQYVIKEIAASGVALSSSYDYVLLAYSGDTTNTYSELVNLGLVLGDVVTFGADLDTLANGSVNVTVLFSKMVEKVYTLILEADGADEFTYNQFFTIDDIITLPVITKSGYVFKGWYTSPDFTGEKLTVLNGSIARDITLYAKWGTVEINNVLDFVSDTVTSYTIDELPSSYEGATLEWSSSNEHLYVIQNNMGYTLRRYQTHKAQIVNVNVKVTKDGVTKEYNKDITINPVLFDEMEHPKAVYFAVGSASSYMKWSTRYNNDKELFSTLFKENMDMVYYAFAIPQEDGTLTINTSLIEKVMELKNYGIRVNIVIDGANRAPLQAMVKLCNNDATRATFVNNIINIVTQYNFDGIDVDWEFPGILSGNAGYGDYTTAVDRTNLNKLLRDLRSKLDSIQDAGGSKYILSVATPPTYWGTDRFDYDGRYSNGVGGINHYCDYVNMMSYDLNKSSTTSHVAHVYSPSNSYSYKFSCDYGVTYYTSLGLSKNKIILGAAAYGKAYNITGTVNEKAKYPALGVTGTLGQVSGYNLPGQSITWNSGTIYYTGIKTLMDSGNFVQYDEYNNDNKFVGSYLYSSKDKVFITFDSELAIKEKCKYASSNPGMGIMVWAYGEDATDTIVNTICNNL